MIIKFLLLFIHCSTCTVSLSTILLNASKVTYLDPSIYTSLHAPIYQYMHPCFMHINPRHTETLWNHVTILHSETLYTDLALVGCYHLPCWGVCEIYPTIIMHIVVHTFCVIIQHAYSLRCILICDIGKTTYSSTKPLLWLAILIFLLMYIATQIRRVIRRVPITNMLGRRIVIILPCFLKCKIFHV